MNFRPAVTLALFAITLATAAAADPTPTPTPAATPVPNTQDLRGFTGKYQAGRSKVTVASSQTAVYRGRARFDVAAPTDTSLKLKIQAKVRTPRGRAAIDNQLTFLSKGIVKGRELAPGIARNAPLTGSYTAKGRRIDFLGTFAFGQTSGTFTGLVRLNAKGRLFVLYSIFVKDQTDPVYTYTYSAIRPKKKK